MKQLLIELEDELAAKLEVIVPGRSRKRSEFVCNAIRKALRDLEDALSAEAYRRTPDAEDAYFDPRVWERVGRRQSQRPKK